MKITLLYQVSHYIRVKKQRNIKGSMTYAPTTNAPARNANVEAYINPDPNPNPNPYPALNQKPNHTHESNSVFGEVSMPEQLSPEHMSCHHIKRWDQQNDLVIRGFCYIRPLYNEVPLYIKISDIIDKILKILISLSQGSCYTKFPLYSQLCRSRRSIQVFSLFSIIFDPTCRIFS